jgi:hypothetical protein
VGGQGLAIPAGYLGFSLEESALCTLLQDDATRGSAYEQLYRNLGPGVIHVSGFSSDTARWAPTGSPSCRTTVLTENEVTAFFQFVRRIGWKVLWGLPLANFDPAAAAAEATYVASVGGSALIGWTIGDEPNLYVGFGLRPAGWGYTEYYPQWEQTRAAVVAAAPGVPILGPDACCEDVVFTQSFAADAVADVSGISFHAYFPTPKTVATLLSAANMQTFASLAGELWSGSAEVDHVPLYLTETNTFSGGGGAGVSNTFVSSLWLSELLFEAATQHVSEADVQQSPDGAPYNPIGPGGTVAPVYYGMLLFHSVVGNGGHLLSTNVDIPALSDLDLSAYAVSAGAGTVRVVLINKAESAATVRVDAGTSYRSASSYQLLAPSLLSTKGVTLAGSSVSSQGTWTPQASTPLPLTGGDVTVTLPPYSVTCIDEVGGGS